MSDERSPPNTASDEAAAWFARLSQRSVTRQALADFREWRRDPANQAAYAEIEDTWSKAGGLESDPDIRRATQAALNRRTLRSRLADLRSRNLLPLALSALSLVLVAALIAIPRLQPPTYSAGVGEQRTVRLEDGSKVRLNTDSRISIHFSRDRRDIRLERGEAFFEAAHDPTRPFIIHAGAADVRAVGTRFDVRRDDGQVRVTLVEGVVRVSRPATGAAWTLRPNQQLLVGAAAAPAPQPVDPTTATSWTDGRLTFQDTPLAEAVAEVNRYSGRQIALAAPDLATVKVNGVFETGDTQAFLAAAQDLFGLTATPQPDGTVRLGRPGQAG